MSQILQKANWVWLTRWHNAEGYLYDYLIIRAGKLPSPAAHPLFDTPRHGLANRTGVQTDRLPRSGLPNHCVYHFDLPPTAAYLRFPTPTPNKKWWGILKHLNATTLLTSLSKLLHRPYYIISGKGERSRRTTLVLAARVESLSSRVLGEKKDAGDRGSPRS